MLPCTGGWRSRSPARAWGSPAPPAIRLSTKATFGSSIAIGSTWIHGSHRATDSVVGASGFACTPTGRIATAWSTHAVAWTRSHRETRPRRIVPEITMRVRLVRRRRSRPRRARTNLRRRLLCRVTPRPRLQKHRARPRRHRRRRANASRAAATFGTPASAGAPKPTRGIPRRGKAARKRTRVSAAGRITVAVCSVVSSSCGSRAPSPVPPNS